MTPPICTDHLHRSIQSCLEHQCWEMCSAHMYYLCSPGRVFMYNEYIQLPNKRKGWLKKSLFAYMITNLKLFHVAMLNLIRNFMAWYGHIKLDLHMWPESSIKLWHDTSTQKLICMDFNHVISGLHYHIEFDLHFLSESSIKVISGLMWINKNGHIKLISISGMELHQDVFGIIWSYKTWFFFISATRFSGHIWHAISI